MTVSRFKSFISSISLVLALSASAALYAVGATGTATNIAVSSGNSQAGIVGTTLPAPFVALVTDSNGNAVAGATVVWAITGGGATFPVASTVTNSSGLASNTMTLGTVTGWDSATAGIATGAKINFGANARVGLAQTIALYSGNGQTGIAESTLPNSLEVLCTDQYGNPIGPTRINWAVLSGGGTLSAAKSNTSSGVAVISLTLGKSPGPNTVSATVYGTTTSNTFTETAIAGPPTIGPPSQIAVSSGNSQAGIVGTTLPTPFVALVTDSNGNPVPGATVVWTITGGGATFPVASTVTNSSGLASNTMTLGTVTGWDSAVAGTATGAKVNFGANALAGFAKNIALYSGNGQTGIAESTLPNSLEVLCTDQYGNTSGTAQVNWAVVSGGGSIPYASSTTSAGVAVKSLTLGKTPGPNIVTATINGTNTSYTFTETAIAGPPTIGPPSQIAISSGNSQAGMVGTALPTPFVALVTDSNGNPVPGTTVVWSITGGGATFPVGSTVTNSSGIASNTMTLGTVTGWDSATAGIATGAKVNVGANAQAGFAQNIAIYSGNQQTGTVGAALPNNLQVLCTDKYGNTSAMAQVDWAATSGGGSFSYYESSTVQGVAAESLTLGTAPGVNTATATIDGTSISTTFTETATVGPAALISIVSGSGQAGQPGVSLTNPFYVKVTDPYGNPLNGIQVDWKALTPGDSFSTSSTITSSKGLTERHLTMGPVYGQHTATATIDGTNISVTFTATYGFAVTLQNNPNPNPAAMEPYFLGLSYPKTWVSVDMFDPNNAATVALFKDLGPGVLRFLGEEVGGAVDWDPTGPGLQYGTTTTADITRVAAFVKAANWKVLYGIGLLNSTPAAAASEAAVAAQEFGSSLLAFEIGNEPNNYALPQYGNPQLPGYTFADYISTTPVYSNGVLLPSWPAYADAIQAAVPNAPLAAAATGASWTIPFAQSNQASKASLLTLHYYAAWPAESPTMTMLLTPDPYVPQSLAQTNAAAVAANITGGVRYSECNSVSGEMPGLTDAFGAALWTIDFLFVNAFNQSGGVAFTSGGSGAGNYTPLVDDLTNVTGIGPDFYGLYAYKLISKGGTLMTTQESPVSSTLSAYVIEQPDGSTDAILSNKDPNNTVTVAVTPQGSISQATSLLLTAPSLTSTTGFTLGGSQINIDGSWTPTSNPAVPLVGNQAVVTVPPGSAQIVHMQ